MGHDFSKLRGKIKELENKKKLIDKKEKEFKENLIKIIEENGLISVFFFIAKI